MSLSKNIYLHRSEQYIYYFRRAIPDCLRKHFGHREIKKSLKTRDKSIAIIRYGIMASQIELKFLRLKGIEKMSKRRKSLKGIDPELLIGLKRDAIATHLSGEDWALMSGVVYAIRGQYLEIPEKEMGPIMPVPVKMKGYELYRIDGNQIDDAYLIPLALAYADAAQIPKLIDEKPFFAKGIFGCEVGWGQEGDLSEELIKIIGEDNFDVEESVGIALPAATIVEEKVTSKPIEAPNKDVMPFSRLVNDYLIYRSDLNETTKEASRKIFEVFLDLNGDIEVSIIGHALVTKFIETVQHKIPANAKKKFPNRTYIEIARMDHQKAGRAMMSVDNINKYLSRLSGLFMYAVNRGYMDKNYAEKKRQNNPVHAKDQTEPFSEAEIVRMFTMVEPWASN
ncbi:MAG: hypothetical protein Q9M08_01815, partial [Mariprofundus sp.]|nr:hypothetical protein [Mariprofundus sp.]